MKTHIALFGVCLGIIIENGPAIGQHASEGNAKTFHPGDTIYPGSQEWIHAGAPRSSETGDSIILIWGKDGKLHRLGFEIQDADGSQVPDTLDNIERRNEQKELAPLREAVQQIAKDIPDKMLSFGNTSAQAMLPKAQIPYDPYEEVVHWADSIAMSYGDPAFIVKVARYYRSPKRLNPWYSPFYIYREKS